MRIGFFKNVHKKKGKPKSKRNNEVKVRKSQERKKLFKIVFIVYVVSISLMLGQFFVFGMCDLLAMARGEENAVTIEIPRNSSKSQIADILYEKGVIKEKSFFNMYINLTKTANNIIPGTYEIKTNLDYQAIISFLKSNYNRLNSDLVDVTIPEGKNILEISDILEKNEVCTKDEFLKVCRKNSFENKFEFLKRPDDEKLYSKLEGYLFPDTYRFYKNINPDEVIKKFLVNCEKKITATDDIDENNKAISVKEKAEKMGMSINDLINIASLIQAEAADENDMYYISSVIHNRLKTAKNQGKSHFGDYGLSKLEMCSTVWYPYKTREKVPEDLLASYDHAYDTYEHEGLPIGPICSPGLVAIDAALNPKSTQYYYFCHDKSRKPYYAKTMGEHQTNLKKAGLL